jgi:hypothetical protein
LLAHILKNHEISLPANMKGSPTPGPISFEEYYVPNFNVKISLR